MTGDSRRAHLPAAGLWLREARTRRGFRTAADFARTLGIDKSLVSNYERGVNAVDDERAEQIAGVLRMDIIEVRRNLGLWVPDEHHPSTGEESHPEDPLVRIAHGDLSQLSREQMLHYVARLTEIASTLAREAEQQETPNAK